MDASINIAFRTTYTPLLDAEDEIHEFKEVVGQYSIIHPGLRSINVQVYIARDIYVLEYIKPFSVM